MARHEPIQWSAHNDSRSEASVSLHLRTGRLEGRRRRVAPLQFALVAVMKCCPNCGQTLNDTSRPFIMGKLQGRIYDRVKRAGRYGIVRDLLVEYTYSDREDGGPDDASRAFDVNLLYLNRKLRPIGQEITQSIPNGPYVLRTIRQFSTLTTAECKQLRADVSSRIYLICELALKYRLTKLDMTALAKQIAPRSSSTKSPFYYRSRRAKEEVPEWPT